MGLNRWLGCIENPRTGREAVAARSARAGDARRRRARGRRRTGRAAGGDRRRRRRATASRCSSATPTPGGQVRLAATVPNRAELGDMVRNQVNECRRLGVDDRVRRRRRRRRRSRARRPDHVDRRHRRRRPASVVGRAGRRPTCATSATCSPARPQPSGAVVRDRRDRVPPRHVGRRAAGRPGLRGRGRHAGHGRRPGPRHHPRHGAVVDAGRRPRASCRRPTSCRWASTAPRSRCCTTRPARDERAHAGLGRARRAGSAGRALYHDLRAAGRSFTVERVGDCVAPRRAHAAVVEGERAGAHVPVRAGRAEVARGSVART